MKTVNYKSDKVVIELTGTINKLPEQVDYKSIGPLLTFELVSYRRRKKEQPLEEIQTDVHQMVLFNDEDFPDKFKNGERLRIKGELQSRNYTKNNLPIDETLQTAVRNYIDIFDDFPTQKKPIGRKRVLIDWKKLLEYSLIPSIPADSAYTEEGERIREKGKFFYRMDENGEIFRETEHVMYEVIIDSYEKVEEERDIEMGDYNHAVIVGKVTSDPYFDVKQNGIAFCSLRICSKSNILKDRHFFNNAIFWGKMAEEVFSEVKKDDLIRIVGRLQSREYVKEEIKRWKTPSGKKKKKAISKSKTAHEISVNKIQKCTKKTNKG